MKTMKNAVVAGLAFALTLLGGLYLGQEYGSTGTEVVPGVTAEQVEIVDPVSTYTTNESIEVVEFAGTIRNTGSGWYVLNDATHEPDAITIGTVTATSVRVNTPGCSQVISTIVGADNEYAQDFGAAFGASVGLNYFVIEGSVSDTSDTGTANDIWNPTVHYTAGTNIWIMGKCLPA